MRGFSKEKWKKEKWDTGYTCSILYDILIWEKSDEEHLQNLEKVIAVLHKHGIKLKKAKCIFFTKEVTY